METLQEKLLAYCDLNGIKPYRIAKHRKTTHNPFPIGTRSVYEVARGKTISSDSQLRLKYFFEQLETADNEPLP